MIDSEGTHSRTSMPIYWTIRWTSGSWCCQEANKSRLFDCKAFRENDQPIYSYRSCWNSAPISLLRATNRRKIPQNGWEIRPEQLWFRACRIERPVLFLISFQMLGNWGSALFLHTAMVPAGTSNVIVSLRGQRQERVEKALWRE